MAEAYAAEADAAEACAAEACADGRRPPVRFPHASPRTTKLYDRTSDQIGKNLTLDDPASALSRLKRELKATLDDLGKKNSDLHAEVRETLAKLDERKKTEQRSALHGGSFEDRLGDLLDAEAQAGNDVLDSKGQQVWDVPRFLGTWFGTLFNPMA